MVSAAIAVLIIGGVWLGAKLVFIPAAWGVTAIFLVVWGIVALGRWLNNLPPPPPPSPEKLAARARRTAARERRAKTVGRCAIAAGGGIFAAIGIASIAASETKISTLFFLLTVPPALLLFAVGRHTSVMAPGCPRTARSTTTSTSASRNFLARRHKVPTRGTNRFNSEAVFGTLGVLRLRRVHIGPPPRAVR